MPYLVHAMAHNTTLPPTDPAAAVALDPSPTLLCGQHIRTQLIDRDRVPYLTKNTKHFNLI
eukprot:SAG11_NODE_346_length_10432_cov_4.883770_1_plen_60_part_10